jgi:hypothetical protein
VGPIQQAGIPWQATARQLAQRVGIDPRYLRRVRWLHKANAVRRNRASVWRNLRFVLLDPEPDNFTFEIANQHELAGWVAAVTGCEAPTAAEFVAEPACDELLRDRVLAATAGRPLWTKRSPPFGKRVGWYALARALHPRLAIEVGVHDGLGSLALLRALERNRDEGRPGRLISFDINPSAGWLVGPHPLWELRIQSSPNGLAELAHDGLELDLFIYDGWHSAEPERADLVAAERQLTPGGVIVSDDAQVTGALARFCDRELPGTFDYHEFHELPRGHFHPGSVLAAARARR